MGTPQNPVTQLGIIFLHPGRQPHTSRNGINLRERPAFLCFKQIRPEDPGDRTFQLRFATEAHHLCRFSQVQPLRDEGRPLPDCTGLVKTVGGS